MFTLVLRQCHKESEDRWKRLSRQVADVILPMLAKQQVRLPPTPARTSRGASRGAVCSGSPPAGAFYQRYPCARVSAGPGSETARLPRRLRAASFPAHPASFLFALLGRVFSYHLQSSLAVRHHLGFLWLNDAVGGLHPCGVQGWTPCPGAALPLEPAAGTRQRRSLQRPCLQPGDHACGRQSSG